MKNDFFNSVRDAVKYWWVSLVIGLIAVVLGFWCLAQPGVTLVTLSALFIAGFLVSGIFEIIFAISNKDTIKGWGWTLASGIISLLFGLLLLATPLATISTMLFFVGFWIMFQSFWAIGTSVDLQRSNIRGWGWMLAFGILGLILSFVLIVNPVFAAGFIVYLLSITLICYGVLRIYYGFRLRSLHKELK